MFVYVTCKYEHCLNQFEVPYRSKGTGKSFCSKKCHGLARRIPLIDRFFKYVGRKQPNGCILWEGTIDKKGYGTIRDDEQKNDGAHRVSYRLFTGSIPDGLFILHDCDTPLCVAPGHLRLGTNIDNQMDKVAKSRQAKGESQGHAKHTVEDILEIRRLYEAKVPSQEIMTRFDLAKSTFWHIVKRESWRHI